MVHAGLGPSNVLTNMAGQEGAIVRARAIATLAMLAVAARLISRYDADGAATASVFGISVLGLLPWRDTYRRLGCRT